MPQPRRLVRLSGSNAFSTIQLKEGAPVPKDVQVLRVGNFKHPRYGTFEITRQVLAEMKKNFDDRVRGIDTAFDYFHDSDKEASAWVEKLELREGGDQLWAVVDWTPAAEKKLAERELRYFSPDFAFKWTDPESGVEHDNVLFGGGLTNRPFVKEMSAIVADEKQTGETDMTELEKAQKALKESEAKVIKLTEDKASVEQQLAAAPAPSKVSELEAQIAKLQQELAAAKQSEQAALSEKAKSEEAAKLAEKTSQFNVLLSEGKACAAQKDAFLKGDMTEFIKLAQPTNAKGSGSSENKETAVDADKASKIIKLAEEKQKADPRLDRGNAISIAKKEIEAAEKK